MNRTVFMLILAAIPLPAAAQTGPSPPAAVRTVDPKPGKAVQIRIATDQTQEIELPQDERAQKVDVENPGALQVSVNGSSNRIYVRSTGTPGRTGVTISGNLRSWRLDVTVKTAAGKGPPPLIRFRSAERDAPAMAQAAISPSVRGLYRLSGDTSLLPSAISDDGAKTYIQWPADVSLPAVFVIDDHGREALANGFMRGDAYVIDSISQRVIFRVDRGKARADRVPVERIAQ